MAKYKKQQYKFFRCSCTSEGILVTKSDWEFPEIYVSVYSYWKHATTFWHRVKEAFRVGLLTFKQGHPYTDEVVLSIQDGYDLGTYLINLAKQLELEVQAKKKVKS